MLVCASKMSFQISRFEFRNFLCSHAFSNGFEDNASFASKFCIARSSQFDGLTMKHISKTQIRPPVPQILETADKPSTWFPPGELVELSTFTNVPKHYNSIKSLFFIIFQEGYFFIFSFFHIFEKFRFSKIEHHFSAI